LESASEALTVAAAVFADEAVGGIALDHNLAATLGAVLDASMITARGGWLSGE